MAEPQEDEKTVDDLVQDLDAFLKTLPGDPAEVRHTVEMLKAKGLSDADIRAFLAAQTK